MTPSPPTPLNRAGSASSTAICLPRWPRSTKPSAARAARDPRLIAYILSRRVVFESEAGDLGCRLADNQEAITFVPGGRNNYRPAITWSRLDEQAAGEVWGRPWRTFRRRALADKHGYQNMSTGLVETWCRRWALILAAPAATSSIA
jgi:hypothetical protein